MRVSVDFDVKCAAQTFLLVDRIATRNPAQDLASVVGCNLVRFWALLVLSVAILQDY